MNQGIGIIGRVGNIGKVAGTGLGKIQRRMLLALVLLGGALWLAAPAAHSASKPILVLGDSLSAEYGIERGSGWVTLLEQKLAQARAPYAVVNASISGDTTSGGRNRLPALLRQHAPSIVIIELGANDGLRGLSLLVTETNLRNMVAEARKAKAKVLLVGIQLPPNYGPEYAQRFGSMFPKIARDTKSALVPFLLEGIAELPHMFLPDRLHPTAEAQPIILDNVWPHLSPLLR